MFFFIIFALFYELLNHNSFFKLKFITGWFILPERFFNFHYIKEDHLNTHVKPPDKQTLQYLSVLFNINQPEHLHERQRLSRGKREKGERCMERENKKLSLDRFLSESLSTESHILWRNRTLFTRDGPLHGGWACKSAHMHTRIQKDV